MHHRITPNHPSLGTALRRMRLLRGIKQTHFAQLMGVNQATVSRWERGQLALSAAQQAAAHRLLAAAQDASQDAALKRLVESSTRKVHLICDRTHRLLAASPSRQAEWRADAAEFMGRSLIGYASAEILAAEATLDGLGWYAGELSSLEIATGANADPVIPIVSGRVLWERIALADGCAGRIVTTIA
ncbi:helix-turn-helix transcriptional regulator [Variovorax sp. efr-133-TYG-130]|uniref:helix-turn-helix transcriptional regulator n=1 Tax=Variovorax sp. efr-133-TYG-130 TaxID=3040327 RepID=UPI002552451B|nr:helix-turn-helix transcriptional regulator [Variovorax sp. efr-133-TYG-130]